MHGHTPGTNMVFLMTKMIGFFADKILCQVSIWHIALTILRMGEYRRENAKHLLHSSWGRGRVNLKFYTYLAEDIN